MHKIDTPSAVNGNFVNKNYSAGIPGTVCDASWLNAVQDEICNLIVGAGLNLDRSNNEQMRAAIVAISNKYATREIVDGSTVTNVSSGGANWRIGNEFEIHPGDVVDVTIECRYNLGSSYNQIGLSIESPSISKELSEPVLRGSGFFSSRYVWKYENSGGGTEGLDAGKAYIKLTYLSYDSQKVSFSINGVNSRA